MKKVLSILSILLSVLVLFACDTPPVDGAEAKLQQAHDNLATLINDPTNVTNSFQVPTVLANGVTATWSSSQAGVITFATPVSGFSNATVNRPAFGDNDAVVTITAVLSLKSELSDDILTKNWSLQVTVKASTVAAINIETIADVLALTDPAYDGGVYQVTIPNITIFAKADVAFGYDGTGVIQLYNSQTNFEVGKVYTISAALEWYFGIWELVEGLGVEDEDATPQYPTKETITSVSAKINALTTAGEHAYANVPDGNFEPIYATVSGRVYMIPEDVSNYNTFLIETGTSTFVAGTTTTPANGLMFYYNTNDLAYVRSFAGYDVTMDVIIYTYRSNNLAFAIYYLGGPEGITADLTDEQAVEVTKSGLQLPSVVYQASTVLSLPTLSTEGVEIAWSYKDAENSENSRINLETGAVTLPAVNTQVEVVLVATLTKGEETDTKEFTVKLGLVVSTISDVYEGTNGTIFKVEATVLGYNGNNQISIADESGAITVFGSGTAAGLAALTGKKVEVIGSRGAFNGLVQLANATFTEIGDGTLPTPTDLSTIETWNATTLLPYQSGLVSVANLKVTAVGVNTFGNVDLTLLDEVSTNTIKFFWDSRQPLDDSAFILGLEVGDYLTLTGALLSWRNSEPSLVINAASQASEGVAPSLEDANKLALDKAELTLPGIATNDLTLPLGPLENGTTVTWESSHPEIIANDGTFVAPEEDTLVTLTATLTNGTATDTKEFEVDAKAPTTGEFATDLFISMYVEGAPGNRKAIQIFNGTGAPVNLANYTVKVAANGGAWGGTAIVLSGTLNHGEVFVIANSADGNFGADLLSNTLNHNGDDAIGLFKNDVLLDVFGVQGEDPGAGWSLSGPGDGTDTVDKVVVRSGATMAPSTTWNREEWTIALEIPSAGAATTDPQVAALLASFDWDNLE